MNDPAVRPYSMTKEQRKRRTTGTGMYRQDKLSKHQTNILKPTLPININRNHGSQPEKNERRMTSPTQLYSIPSSLFPPLTGSTIRITSSTTSLFTTESIFTIESSSHHIKSTTDFQAVRHQTNPRNTAQQENNNHDLQSEDDRREVHQRTCLDR